MLQAVATAVLTRDSKALHLRDVEHLVQACKSKKATNTLSHIEAIVAMFKNEDEALPVICNQQLDKHLYDLEVVATSSLSKANNDAKMYIPRVFPS